MRIFIFNRLRLNKKEPVKKHDYLISVFAISNNFESDVYIFAGQADGTNKILNNNNHYIRRYCKANVFHITGPRKGLPIIQGDFCFHFISLADKMLSCFNLMLRFRILFVN